MKFTKEEALKILKGMSPEDYQIDCETAGVPITNEVFTALCNAVYGEIVPMIMLYNKSTQKSFAYRMAELLRIIPEYCIFDDELEPAFQLQFKDGNTATFNCLFWEISFDRICTDAEI